MMELSVRPLSRKQVRCIYRREMKATFPPAELRPLWNIFNMMRQGNYHALGFYRGDEWMGYAFLWQGEEFTLLDYLATLRGKRGQGVGSQMLTLLAQRYAHTAGLIVEIEAKDVAATAKENATRTRRFHFYRRNGFVDLGYQAHLFDVRYTMLGRFLSATPDNKAAMQAHATFYRNHVPLPMYRRFVQIPIQKKEGSKPC